MKKMFLMTAALAAISASALEIDKNYVIVSENPKGQPEVAAAKMLSGYLSRIFGKTIPVVKTAGQPSIILKSDAKLGGEEWKIFVQGPNLVISGGWPRGVYYGAAEFLEKIAGVRSFTPWEERVPRAEKLHFNDKHVYNRTPAFPLCRSVSDGLELKKRGDHLIFNKVSSTPSSEPWPSLFNMRGIGSCHTFHLLTDAVPKNRPDLLPLGTSGQPERAVNDIGPNQICFANPEFRALAKKEIARWIEKEKKFSAAKKVDTPWSSCRWVDVSQNDNISFCQCKACAALIGKYGTLSGAQLDFINDIASAFPDRIIQTFAYQTTQSAPKNIRARDNVMIQFACLGDNHRSYADLLRPLSALSNKWIVNDFAAWAPVAKNKAVWAYHRLYTQTEAFPWPQCMYYYIGENMRFYHRTGVRKMYLESEYSYGHTLNPRAFDDLHRYLGIKMMDDPEQDENKLIEEFFRFMYGPAVPEMKAYADYLKKRIASAPMPLTPVPLKHRGILDESFFRTVKGLLDKAEAKAVKSGDKGLLLRIRLEKLPVELAAANMWEEAAKKVYPSREKLCDDIEALLKLAYQRYYPDPRRRYLNLSVEECWAKEMQKLRGLRNPLPVPPEFADREVIQIPAVLSPKVNVRDPDAACGGAIKFAKVPKERLAFDHPNQPMEFGLYDYTTGLLIHKRIIRPEEIKTDGKYHLYHFGKVTPNGHHKEYFWAHRSWAMRLNELYRPLWVPQDMGRSYDLYISCKFTGPAYVKGSKDENAVYVDKFVAVKLTKNKEK